MNVLIIAPFAPDLPGVLGEVQEVANTLGAKIAQGIITDEKISNVVRRHGPFDLTIFAGHLGEEGFPRGDGNYLPLDRFTMMLGDTGITFINACDGERLVDMIRSRTSSHVITTTSDIDDGMALQAMRTFTDGVADTGDIQHAFSRLKETRQYDFFENRAGVVVTQRSSGSASLESRVERLESIVAELQESVSSLSLIVKGSSDIGLQGLRYTVDDMKTKLNDMHKTVNGIRADMLSDETPEFLRKHATAIVVSMFCLLILGIIVQYVQ